jgi:hypothetical protein
LNGLGSIRNLRRFVIQNSSLSSLAGLRLPASMATVQISESRVVDLEPFQGVTEISGELSITSAPRLSSLDSFASLRRVGVLVLNDNGILLQIDALNGLLAADSITIQRNGLDHLPDFDGVTSLANLDIQDNPALRDAPSLPQATRIEHVTIRNNPRLEQVVLPALTLVSSGSPDFSEIVIAENQVLSQVHLPQLNSAGSLVVASNPALTVLDLPALSTVGNRFTVVGNSGLPSASLSVLGGVQSSLRKIGGNQGDSPLALCLWPNDDHCDEALGLCSAGSDAPDCDAGFPPF